MADSATEDILSLALIVGGYTLTGLAGGSPIRFANGNDQFSVRVGVGGNHSFTRINDESGDLLVDLLPTSDSNDALSLMIEFSKKRANGAAFAASLIDTSGRFSVAAQSVVIARHPDVAFGDGTSVNTWTLKGGKWSRFTGGRGATPVFTYEEVQQQSQSAGNI
jgi:hypothetical protein